MRTRTLVLITMTLFGATGCGRLGGGASGDAAMQAAAVVDAAEVAATTSALGAAAVAGATYSADSATSARAAAAQLTAAMQPAGCATATQTGTTVVYRFASCSGPYGLVRVNGTLTVAYTTTLTTLSATITSSELSVGGVALEVSARASSTRMPGGAETLSLTHDASATGARGHEVVVSGANTIGWDAAGCVTAAGSGSATIDGDSFSTTTSSFARCPNACPAAGGTFVFASPAATITIRFDGTATAAWSTDGDRSGTIPLVCS